MTKIQLIPVALLACLLGACGAPFTAEDLSGLGEAGEAPQGAAGTAAAGSASQAGAPSTAGAGGGVVPAAGAAGTSGGGSGGTPVLDTPPCAHAIDTVSPGSLSLGKDTCYRTKEAFDTIDCLGRGWVSRTLKINGVLAECNQTQVFAPPVNGYNYFELVGPYADSDELLWRVSANGMSCWGAIESELVRCPDFREGDFGSYGGKNYLCSSPTCNCTDPASLPGGSANAWTDLGACGE